MAIKDGADYVYALGHIGKRGSITSQKIIENTTGIDVFIDGHSHDEEQMIFQNANGKEVIRTACGSHLKNVGYSIITEKGIIDPI